MKKLTKRGARTVTVAVFAAAIATMVVAGEVTRWQPRRWPPFWAYNPNPPALSEVWWHGLLAFALVFMVLKANKTFLRLDR